MGERRKGEMAGKVEHVTRHRMCGFGCGQKATVYGGYSGANDWACYACDDCASEATGFKVWDKICKRSGCSRIAASCGHGYCTDHQEDFWR